MSAKILLLEDDFVLSDILCEFLEEQGFSVVHCEDASSALELAYEQKFDILLLDVKVPKGEDFVDSNKLPGFALLKELREIDINVPCIFITSLNSLKDVEDGYSAGCDDYMKKPFELVELKLRIQTLLKRSFAHKNEEFEDFGNGVKYYFFSKMLYSNDKIVNLTQKENLLLDLLLRRANSFVSQSAIFEELWGVGQEPSELSLRAYVKNLRKIIGKEKIINSHNKGYCYVRG